MRRLRRGKQRGVVAHDEPRTPSSSYLIAWVASHRMEIINYHLWDGWSPWLSWGRVQNLPSVPPPSLVFLHYSFISVMNPLRSWFVEWILLNVVSSYCHSYKPRNRRLLGWAENSWLGTRQRTNSYAKLCARTQSLIGGTMESLLCENQTCWCLSTCSVDQPQVWMKCLKTEWVCVCWGWGAVCFAAVVLASRLLLKWLCSSGVYTSNWREFMPSFKLQRTYLVP